MSTYPCTLKLGLDLYLLREARNSVGDLYGRAGVELEGTTGPARSRSLGDIRFNREKNSFEGLNGDSLLI